MEGRAGAEREWRGTSPFMQLQTQTKRGSGRERERQGWSGGERQPKRDR